VALYFETQVLEGRPILSNETTEFGYFTLEEVEGLEMFGRHKARILDTLEKHPQALIK
jgi:hypothetical protein